MTSIIGKRLSLHRELEAQQSQSSVLKSRISQLQALSNIGTASCMIAHELNNLLTPLGNYANLAIENPDDRALTEKALTKTVLNCERACRIMDSILKTANGETQEKKKVRLITLVEEIFACLCRDFAKDGIAVQVDIAEDLEMEVVPVQIQQALMNLILNARSAMLPGGGHLSIRAEDDDATVRIEVRDSGCGIKETDLKRIFEPFFTTQADKNQTTQTGGAGLGLTFCKEVINAHGGCISVESNVAEGSTFKITLPAN